MSQITTLLFDLGGVLINLDQGKTLRAFQKLGADLEEVNAHTTLFTDFEKGKINADEFRQGLLEVIRKPMLKEQIDNAWNAMLLDIPQERIKIIKQLRKRFSIGLLSNTNSIHIDFMHQYLKEEGRYEEWRNLFDEYILSYETGMRKPDVDIYLYAAEKMNCGAHQCVFIDDSPVNLKGAEKAGIKTVLANTPLNQELLQQILIVSLH